jgi:hypothetical protein
MNYIKHLSTFFEIVAEDNRLNALHVSLYITLFQYWNLNRFENPFQINRGEVLKICKIGSLNTYHKCLHELNDFGYLEYLPSHNPMKGSLINLYNFDTTDNTTLDANLIQHLYNPRRISDTTVVQPSAQNQYNPRRKSDTTLASLYKHNKHINNKTYIEGKTQNFDQNLNLENLNNVKIEVNDLKEEKRKKVAPKKESKMIVPMLDEVTGFFKSENYTEIEAQKFFNHYESNGWKVGGKTPMKNWRAAARNWMLNSHQFASQNQNQRPHLKQNKNYSEPL